MKLTVEFLSVPRDGETTNGDGALVRREADGSLLAVIDALGHGARAAEATAVATAYLHDVALDRGIAPLIDGLHERLRGTRGAAAMLLVLGGGRLQGCGVGNVDVRGHGQRVPAVLTPGVLGGQLSRVKVFEAPLSPRGRIVMFSDGISARFALEELSALPTRDACRTIMDRHRRSGDDATVLVTDFEA